MKEGHGTMMSRSHFWNFEFSITAWFFGEEVTMYEWEGACLVFTIDTFPHTTPKRFVSPP